MKYQIYSAINEKECFFGTKDVIIQTLKIKYKTQEVVEISPNILKVNIETFKNIYCPKEFVLTDLTDMADEIFISALILNPAIAQSLTFILKDSKLVKEFLSCQKFEEGRIKVMEYLNARYLEGN